MNDALLGSRYFVSAEKIDQTVVPLVAFPASSVHGNAAPPPRGADRVGASVFLRPKPCELGLGHAAPYLYAAPDVVEVASSCSLPAGSRAWISFGRLSAMAFIDPFHRLPSMILKLLERRAA